MTGRKTIAQAPSGEDTASDGTEKIPVSSSKYMLVSTIAEYIRTLVQTLTNKTLTTPTIADFTNAAHDHGDADDGGALATSITITTPTIASFANATHNHEAAAGGGTLDEDALALTDVTTNNASTSKHGLLQKLSNVSTEFMNGQGNWATPAGGSGLPAGHIYGLTLSNNGTDPTNDIDIATGKARDSTDAVDISLASALTKQLDAAW